MTLIVPRAEDGPNEPLEYGVLEVVSVGRNGSELELTFDEVTDDIADIPAETDCLACNAADEKFTGR